LWTLRWPETGSLTEFLAPSQAPLRPADGECATLGLERSARMTSHSSMRTAGIVAGLFAALVLGIGLGAASFSVLDDDATTVIRQVTVTTAEQTAETSALISGIYTRASRGVVEIRATSTDTFGDPSSSAQGSGFVYDRKGHVVTNQHVVAGADTYAVSLWDGTEYDAKLVGTDPSTDLAVLRLDASRSSLEPLALGDSSAVSVGDPVLALGSPFGLEGTLTRGIVSALHRQMTAPNRYTITDTIQTDAAINHGNSGGPLLDLRGRVIGVNAQIESESGGSDGVGFAIPSNTVSSIVSQLIATGTVKHAYLGIAMVAVPGGVAVTQVRAGTPAEEAGLESASGTSAEDGREVPTGGDVIVSFDGVEVATPADLQAAVDARSPGDTVELTILRDGARKVVRVTLGERP
jgi:putative serine protease PepD